VIDELAREGRVAGSGPAEHVALAWDAVLRLLEQKDSSFRN